MYVTHTHFYERVHNRYLHFSIYLQTLSKQYTRKLLSTLPGSIKVSMGNEFMMAFVLFISNTEKTSLGELKHSLQVLYCYRCLLRTKLSFLKHRCAVSLKAPKDISLGIHMLLQKGLGPYRTILL